MHYDAHQPVLDDLAARIATIRSSLSFDEKVRDREALQEQMNQADFWNDQEAAQKVIESFKLLKAQTEGLEAIIAEYEEAQVGYELAREGGDDELLAEVDEQLHTLAGQMGRVELQSLLSGKHDHRNCFVSIQSRDGVPSKRS